MSKEPIADAMADCILPEEIMLCILTLLPVKSLLRFKSVCKPWRKLISAPKFIKMHHDQFSSDPKNQAFIVYSRSGLDDQKMSLFNVESNTKKPTNLDSPYPKSCIAMYSVGCCNGLVCIGFIPFHRGIALWNPALRLSKSVRIPDVDFRVAEHTSLGFGYDAEGDDFQVVRIGYTITKTGFWVEVYSAQSDSWKTIEAGFQFRVLWTKSSANVNGDPYWVATVDKSDGVKTQLDEVLLRCDMTKLEFKILPLSTLTVEKVWKVPFVEWKGSLAALVCTRNEDRVESVDVWVFDDGEMIWRKNHTFGPIEMRVDRYLQCSKYGKIMGKCIGRKLFVFDPETGYVKVIEIGEGQQLSFEIYGYSESLSYIKGMEQVVAKNEEEEDED